MILNNIEATKLKLLDSLLQEMDDLSILVSTFSLENSQKSTDTTPQTPSIKVLRDLLEEHLTLFHTFKR